MKHIKAAPFGNRMLQTGSVPAGQLLANPANFRVHPVEQQTVLATMLERIGFIQSVIVNKRSMASGYAGLDNELFYMDKTMMVFGDAKKVVEDMVKAVE